MRTSKILITLVAALNLFSHVAVAQSEPRPDLTCSTSTIERGHHITTTLQLWRDSRDHFITTVDRHETTGEEVIDRNLTEGLAQGFFTPGLAVLMIHLDTTARIFRETNDYRFLMREENSRLMGYFTNVGLLNLCTQLRFGNSTGCDQDATMIMNCTSR